MMNTANNEQRYFDALKIIATSDTPERLRKHSEADYGLLFEEAMEMEIENIQAVAKAAIKGKRRPA
jgi:hypothetical protein